jgi:hypothetical protein
MKLKLKVQEIEVEKGDEVWNALLNRRKTKASTKNFERIARCYNLLQFQLRPLLRHLSSFLLLEASFATNTPSFFLRMNPTLHLSNNSVSALCLLKKRNGGAGW